MESNMKYTQRHFSLSKSLLIAASVTSLLCGCEGAFTNVQSGSSAARVADDIQGTVGVRNVTQLAKSMSVVTGVNMNENFTVGTVGANGFTNTAATAVIDQASAIRPLLSVNGKIEDMN